MGTYNPKLEEQTQAYWEVSRVWNHRPYATDRRLNVQNALKILVNVVIEVQAFHKLSIRAAALRDDIISHGNKTEKIKSNTVN